MGKREPDKADIEHNSVLIHGAPNQTFGPDHALIEFPAPTPRAARPALFSAGMYRCRKALQKYFLLRTFLSSTGVVHNVNTGSGRGATMARNKVQFQKGSEPASDARIRASASRIWCA
jgi:hypothetical protein